ncbi:MAG: hypothetical protein HZB43_03060 [candidate division Zixibacteria bacterium]|nr:hypothetical protein [candidate division Zixibacteria bacterium]
MYFGIAGVVVVIALVLALNTSSFGKSKQKSAYSAAFRHVAAQVDSSQAAAVEQEAFKVLVFHPAERSDFKEIEKQMKSLARTAEAKTEFERHVWGEPATTVLARSLRLQISPQQTIVVVVSPSQAFTWGGPEEIIVTADPNIAFPSPQMCEIIKSAQQGRDVLLVFSGAGAPSGAQLVSTATEYVQNPANAAEMFVIDPSDPANEQVVARTQLPPDSLKDARMLFMVAGQVRGQLSGAIKATDIQALKKTCSGKAGCC